MSVEEPRRALHIKQIEETLGCSLIDILKVQFPHTVDWEIDVRERTVRIGRIVVVLKAQNFIIPGGWRLVTRFLSGIDRRVKISDTHVMPEISPGVEIPIAEIEIPRISKDIIKSADEWHVELYIADSSGNERQIHKTPAFSFATLRELAKAEAKERIRGIPKEQRVKTDRCELLCSDAGKRCRYLIYAKPKLIFGKRETNDIVLQLFPRNPENDAATAKISREHGKFEYNKGRWTLQDTSMNHTWINDKYMSKDSTETLHDGDKIVVARALELQFHCDDKYARIDRLNNLAGEEAYILMIESVTIGSDPNNGIVLLDAGVSAFHARIFHKDGEFFIQAVGDDSSVVVNDSPLKQNEVCPLGKNMEFSIGKFTLGVQAHND